MRILLTNDDGIDCEGLRCLLQAFQKTGRHEICVIAPDSNRSGVSHSVTLGGPIRLAQRGPNAWACSGTPADCAIVASFGAVPFTPELVVSGINVGPNIGTDLVFSGTAAAARQATLHGLPAVAVSLASHRGPFGWEDAATFTAEHVEEFAALWHPDAFVNVNIPNGVPSGDLRMQQTFPSRRRYGDGLAVFHAPDGNTYCFLESGEIDTDRETGSDMDAVSKGFVSVGPVFIHPVALRDLKSSAPDHAAVSARPDTVASAEPASDR